MYKGGNYLIMIPWESLKMNKYYLRMIRNTEGMLLTQVIVSVKARPNIVFNMKI